MGTNSQLTFLGLTFASTQISFGTLMQFGFSTNLTMVRIYQKINQEDHDLDFLKVRTNLGTRTVSILQSS